MSKDVGDGLHHMSKTAAPGMKAISAHAEQTWSVCPPNLCIYLCGLYALHTGQSLQTVDLHGVLSLTDEPSVKLQAAESGYW